MDYRPLKSGLPTGRLPTILITAFLSISATLILLRLTPPGGKVSSFVPVAVGPPPPPPQNQDGSSRTGGEVVVVPEVDVGGFGNGFDEEEAKVNSNGGTDVVVVTWTSVVVQTATSMVTQSANTGAASVMNPNCHPVDGALEVLREMEEKYSSLRDDKFTITIGTYKRPKELNKTISVLLSAPIPSLHELVIIQNDLNATLPEDYVSPLGVPVRYVMSEVNSMNNRLTPDPLIQTQAIFSSDDDVYFQPSDLEWGFHTWRNFGRDRIVGAHGRCVGINEAGETWYKSKCSTDGGEESYYQMVLVGLAFIHIKFMGFYASAHPLAVQVRDLVDETFNCDDLAMNYVVSMLTCQGPLLLRGQKPWMDQGSPEGISHKSDHQKKRDYCLRRMEDWMSGSPLVNVTGHMRKGYTDYQGSMFGVFDSDKGQ
ncbi:glycosyl transferase family 64 domain-containing protein [Leptodontidium sp. 2 PMI_412]|nr:glycosyl transferase family 64 domain-containing protein [Leptodontidium sp. 2 PMI_412]